MLDRQALWSKLFGSAIITTVGYHATSAAVAGVILEEARFRPSRNPYDWLGDGVYFWEAAPERAWEWAHRPRVQTRLGPDIAIIGARIRLERCIDLHDTVWHEQIRAVSETLQRRYAARGTTPPRQTAGGLHGWDRQVMNYLARRIYQQTNVAVGAVRASFREPLDEPIFGGSALYRGAHVQIAVRDESLIEEAWLERGSV